MTKKMRELLGKIEIKVKEAKELAATDSTKAAAILDEMDELKAQYDTEKRLYEAEQSMVPDDPQPPKGEFDGGEEKTVSGFEVIAKMLKGRRLEDKEKALITGGTNGEDLLLPEDVRLAIVELRKQYKSAKPLVGVLPTTALTGSFNFEDGEVVGLVDFEDGADIDDTDAPKFAHKPFAIKFKGKIIPVSNILKGAEKAGLMAYINRWFLRNAIISENKDIFAKLAEGKTAKTLASWDKLKSSINKDLDPSAKIGARIVTNQTGFDILDSAVDGQGRPILQENPANATQKLFQSLPIEVFSDAELPNVGGKAPVFYGNLEAGIYFIDYQHMNFASSEHALFGKNQTALRVIEGYDVIQADTGAYLYGLLGAGE